MINLTIDNQKIESPEGATILDAAKAAGVYIPTLCHVKGLKPFGACRICLVKVANMPKLATACTTPVTPGMVVETDTPEIHRYRKFVVEMILSDHDFRCGVCEANSDCTLQDLAYKYGLQGETYQGEKRKHGRDEANPFIERDHSRCILCGACVRVCDEVQHVAALDFSRRGFATKISPAYDKPLDCQFCGQCMHACPTGAISSKPAKRQVRAWELAATPSVCSHCGCGCNIDLMTADGRLVKVSPTADTPVNQGCLCVKGNFGHDAVHSPDRLTTPLIMENGQFREAGWEEALNLVAKRLGEIKTQYGPDAIGGLASARCTNEDNYLFQKFMRAAVGTNNVDYSVNPSQLGLAEAFGCGAMTNSIADIAQAKTILVIGSDTTAEQPIIGLEVLRAVRQHGAKLIVADPRRIRLTRYAQVWMCQKPGTEAALLNGMANVILAEGLEDKKFIAERTEGFEALKNLVAGYTPERVEQITGVPAEMVRAAARLYAQAGKAAIFYPLGLDQQVVRAIANLAMLTGNIGRPGAGINSLRGQNNLQGASDMGARPDFYPGYQKVADSAARHKFETAWGVGLSDKPGLTGAEMINSTDGRLKALYVMGENIPGLKNPGFLVVQDISLTETAKLADVVLPAAAFVEKDGTYTNTERRVQRIRQAINPPGQAKADWQIICELSRRLGYPMDYTGAAQIMDEAAKLIPIYGGIAYDRLEGCGLQWPCPDKNHPGTPVLHTERFPRGLGKFILAE